MPNFFCNLRRLLAFILAIPVSVTAFGADSQTVSVPQPTPREEAERAITWETGLVHVDVRLVHAAVTGATLDGYPLANPVGFQGRTLTQIGRAHV